MGYYCSICFLFYVNEEAAKRTHCSSQAHYSQLQVSLTSLQQLGPLQSTPGQSNPTAAARPTTASSRSVNPTAAARPTTASSSSQAHYSQLQISLTPQEQPAPLQSAPGQSNPTASQSSSAAAAKPTTVISRSV
ncbi:hypothetical protein WMY93_012001 [Mugilogobius chulae]|uniref:Matrin-type domain-containing protein n=1 Tax=Mugilogobius chulae TaxID=88201 RepID=A0AAW0P4I4_9GOBI